MLLIFALLLIGWRTMLVLVEQQVVIYGVVLLVGLMLGSTVGDLLLIT